MTASAAGPLAPPAIREEAETIVVLTDPNAAVQALRILSDLERALAYAEQALVHEEWDRVIDLLPLDHYPEDSNTINGAVRRVHALTKEARNGDLDMRSLVMAQVPEDGSFVAVFAVHSQLRSFDPRTQVACIPQPPYGHEKSPSDVMIERLVEAGDLVRHGGQHAVRRRRPSDKKQAR